MSVLGGVDIVDSSGVFGVPSDVGPEKPVVVSVVCDVSVSGGENDVVSPVVSDVPSDDGSGTNVVVSTV